MTTNMMVNPDRLWADIMSLGEITDPSRSFTRRSFSALFIEGRDWLAARFTEIAEKQGTINPV